MCVCVCVCIRDVFNTHREFPRASWDFLGMGIAKLVLSELEWKWLDRNERE